MNYDKAFVLTDTNTIKYCYPAAKEHLSRIDASISDSSVITIGASDVEKNLSSVTHVWEALQKGGATRHSLLVNLGGGMVTDLGGFAASTFKRGIDFINIPTTLLSMVDASVGGKTGFNFGGLKNEIGVFSDPKEVILDTSFLSTLDEEIYAPDMLRCSSTDSSIAKATECGTNSSVLTFSIPTCSNCSAWFMRV